MFNSSVRREALEKLDGAVNRYESIRKSVERASVRACGYSSNGNVRLVR